MVKIVLPCGPQRYTSSKIKPSVPPETSSNSSCYGSIPL